MGCYFTVMLFSFMLVLVGCIEGMMIDEKDMRWNNFIIRLLFGLPIAFFLLMTCFVLVGTVKVIPSRPIWKNDGEIKAYVVENGRVVEADMDEILKSVEEQKKQDNSVKKEIKGE